MKKLKQLKTELALAVLMGAPALANANQTANAIGQGKVILIAVAGFITALAAAAGVWLAFTGVMGIVNKESSQASAGQNMGKVIGGIILASLMAWITMLLVDLGVDGQNQTEAINQEVFGSQQ